MNYLLLEVKLDKDHPYWPNETVWKIKNLRTGFIGFGCYTSENAANEVIRRLS